MEISLRMLNNANMPNHSNIYSFDALIEKKSKRTFVNVMTIEKNAPSDQVITMRIRKNLNAPVDAAYDDLVFLCREDQIAHIVQMYSGSEVQGAPKDSIFYKNTPFGDVLKHPSLHMQELGAVDDFLAANLSLADAIAEEALILMDQLMLCRAVHHMIKSHCTAKEALEAANQSNKLAIQSQMDLEKATSKAISAMAKN